jgi:AbrB family looped-hinge helix DNA binding protein
MQVVKMETTATTKGQVVIPSSIRRKLGIKTGTRIQVEIDESSGHIILKPITREYIERMAGKFRGLPLIKDLERERKLDKQREDRKFRKLSSKK